MQSWLHFELVGMDYKHPCYQWLGHVTSPPVEVI